MFLNGDIEICLEQEPDIQEKGAKQKDWKIIIRRRKVASEKRKE